MPSTESQGCLPTAMARARCCGDAGWRRQKERCCECLCIAKLPVNCYERSLFTEKGAHQDGWDRTVTATIIAEALLSHETNHYPAYLQSQRCDRFRVFTGRGPARPPSPFDRSVSAYEPLIADRCDNLAFLSPPVYGIRPGFSYAPFWSVLVGCDDSDDE